MGVLGAGAVEPLVAVLALEAEPLPLVDRADVLLQADLRGQLLPAYVAHHATAVLGLLVPEMQRILDAVTEEVGYSNTLGNGPQVSL